MFKTDGGTRSRNGMGRRDFLVLSSAAALGVATTGFGSEAANSIGFTGAARPFSVGFTEAVLTRSSTGIHSMVAADAIRFSHRDFQDDLARVTVHGFWSGNTAPRSVAMAAYFQDGAVDHPFVAWAHVHRGNASALATSFRVPIRKDGSLMLGFESRDPLTAPRNALTRRLQEVRAQITGPHTDSLVAAATDEKSAARCAFGSSAVKLRRGTYVVAFRDSESAPKPNWNALQLALGETPLAQHTASPLVRSSIGTSAVPFDYLLFSIDQA